MSVTSRRRSDPSGMLAAKLTVMLWPEGAAVPSTFTRLRPSSTVMRVVEPSKVAPSGSCRVTDETPSPDSTVPSQVRRVSIAPMTPEPPSSLGLAVAFSVVMASAACGVARATPQDATSTAANRAASACARPPLLLGSCIFSPFVSRGRDPSEERPRHLFYLLKR